MVGIWVGKESRSNLRVLLRELVCEGRKNGAGIIVTLPRATLAEQKKDAPNIPFATHRSTTVWAMVDFQVPARPLSQKIGGLFKSSAHPSISSRRATRVPLRQPWRSLWLYPAPAAGFRREPSSAAHKWTSTKRINDLTIFLRGTLR